jgi:hypothetical protein
MRIYFIELKVICGTDDPISNTNQRVIIKLNNKKNKNYLTKQTKQFFHNIISFYIQDLCQN